MTDERAYEIVVFGATGFTGGLVASYLAAHGGELRWALAGRDAAKLARVRERLGMCATPPELVVADAHDEPALRALAARTRVLITTVGPYVKYGEPLVRACAEQGTHYVDLTGEPAFVANSRERYHELARARGAKIVHACGFDSIPHDLGAYFTVQALRRMLGDEQAAGGAISMRGVVRARGAISGGTWQSALEIMASQREQWARQAAGDSATPRSARALSRSLRFDRQLGLWTVPLPTIDPLIVAQSARTLPEYGPNFRYGHFVGVAHGYQVAALLLGVGALFGLAQIAPARALLGRLKPAGVGPSEAQRQQSWFRVTFEAECGPHSVRCEVRGGDPGYDETAKMIAEAALALARDGARLPPHFGVVTSAAALGNVLIERLVRAGISFEVCGTGPRS